MILLPEEGITSKAISFVIHYIWKLFQLVNRVFVDLETEVSFYSILLKSFLKIHLVLYMRLVERKCVCQQYLVWLINLECVLWSNYWRLNIQICYDEVKLPISTSKMHISIIFLINFPIIVSDTKYLTNFSVCMRPWVIYRWFIFIPSLPPGPSKEALFVIDVLSLDLFGNYLTITIIFFHSSKLWVSVVAIRKYLLL